MLCYVIWLYCDYHGDKTIFIVFFQTFIPLLKLAASADADKPMSCSRAAIINISTGVASISENSSGRSYDYRASKVGINL